MRDIIKVTIRLMAIMLVAGLCLGAAYTVTKDPIANQKAAQAEASRKAVLAGAASFEAIELSDSGNISDCYRGLDASGAPCGYAVTVNAKGFGGTVVLTVGVADGSVTGVRVTSHSETPGLGAKAAEEAFSSQFIGKSGKLLVNKTGATNEQEVTAITAATITSQAVTNAVNEVLEFASNLSDDSSSVAGASHLPLFDVSKFDVLPQADSFEEYVPVTEGVVTGYSLALDAAGDPCGYAISAEKEGFGGPIWITVGVADGAITGVRFDKNSESPDYGGKMVEESFYGQFAGKTGGMTVIKDGAASGNEIVSITAATSSSQTVVDAINEVMTFAATLK